MAMKPLDCKITGWDEGAGNKFVVVFSRYKGKLLLSRHKGRATWETQGGHIEPGETALDAARRELWEESGAAGFTIEPVCRYYAWDVGDEQNGSWGAVFFADIAELGPLPESEMAETHTFDALPENVTYPGITPRLYERVHGRFERR